MVPPTDPTDTILLLTECFASQPLLCIIPPHPNSQSVIKNQLQAAMDGIGYMDVSFDWQWIWVQTQQARVYQKSLAAWLRPPIEQ